MRASKPLATGRARPTIIVSLRPRQLRPDLPEGEVERILVEPPRPQPDAWWLWPNVHRAQRRLAQRAMQNTPPYPGESGRGIVVVGGGKYFVSAYVTIRVLRHVGCHLPIELWHLRGEMNRRQKGLVRPWGVRCVDADSLTAKRPFRFLDHWWRGWQLKAYALLHCGFREVLLLDADCYPVRNPEFLFRWSGYQTHGAAFWPDLLSEMGHFGVDPFAVLGIKPLSGAASESGQLLLDRGRCWKELCLAAHYNSQADFVYKIVYGDKDTFPLAWLRLNRPFARPWPYCTHRPPGLIQHGPDGLPLFQHRIGDKFRLCGVKFDGSPQGTVENLYHPRMEHELFCFRVLEELAELWPASARSENGRATGGRPASARQTATRPAPEVRQ